MAVSTRRVGSLYPPIRTVCSYRIPGLFISKYVLVSPMDQLITDIKHQKHDRNRFSVSINGEYRFSVSVDSAAALRKGQTISDEQIQSIVEADRHHQAYHHAVRFLGVRRRSVQEIRIYLNRRGYSEQTVDCVVEKLLDQQYLNDEKFAREWIEHRKRNAPRSRIHLRCELKQKGIADGVIDNVMNEVDEFESAWRAVKRNLFRWKHLETGDIHRKLFSFLSRKGFHPDACRYACERVRITPKENEVIVSDD